MLHRRPTVRELRSLPPGFGLDAEVALNTRPAGGSEARERTIQAKSDEMHVALVILSKNST